MRDEHRKNFTSGIVFLLFGIFIFAGSYTIPATTSDVLGSRFFPRAVAVLIGILSIAQIILSAGAFKAAARDNEDNVKEAVNKPLMLTVAALLIYYVLVLQIGFTITSIIYLFCQSLILMPAEDIKNKKKLIVPVLVSVIVPIAVNAIFWNLFSIKLPPGNLF